MDNTRLPKHALNYKPRGRKIVDALGNDGNASMPEEVKRPDPWKKKKKKKKKMMMMMMMSIIGESAGNLQFSLKSDKNDRYLTWTPVIMHNNLSLSSSKRRYILSVKLSDFIVWRHTWRKIWVNCAILSGNIAGLRNVLSSRLSHKELRSSPEESHTHIQFSISCIIFMQLNCTV